MYDAVNLEGVPADATMVAGYVDGHFQSYNGLKARFPHAVHVGIAVSAHTNAGQVLDVENGDATPSQAVSWVSMRRAAGQEPTVYCATSTWLSVRSAFHTHGVAEPHYWIAHWDGSTAIPNGAVAKQYRSGKSYDTSVVLAHWPGVDPVSKPAPKPAPKPKPPTLYIVKKGDTFSSIAAAHHISLARLEELNPAYKHNYNLIYPGDKIHV
jgi:hypothetical protein